MTKKQPSDFCNVMVDHLFIERIQSHLLVLNAEPLKWLSSTQTIMLFSILLTVSCSLDQILLLFLIRIRKPLKTILSLVFL